MLYQLVGKYSTIESTPDKADTTGGYSTLRVQNNQGGGGIHHPYEKSTSEDLLLKTVSVFILISHEGGGREREREGGGEFQKMSLGSEKTEVKFTKPINSSSKCISFNSTRVFCKVTKIK